MPGRNTAFLPQEKFDEIRSTYSRFNEPWLKEEIEELKSMAAENVPEKDMATQLQRTPSSIRMKLKSLGLYVPSSQPAAKWSEEDNKELIRMYGEGLSFADIADHFGRSINAVVTHLVHLRVNLFS